MVVRAWALACPRFSWSSPRPRLLPSGTNLGRSSLLNGAPTWQGTEHRAGGQLCPSQPPCPPPSAPLPGGTLVLWPRVSMHRALGQL